MTHLYYTYKVQKADSDSGRIFCYVSCRRPFRMAIFHELDRIELQKGIVGSSVSYYNIFKSNGSHISVLRKWSRK